MKGINRSNNINSADFFTNDEIGLKAHLIK